MKRRLLLQLVALLSVMGVQAYDLGDYIYTADAKFKVTGENLVQNGNFQSFDGWSTKEGAAVNTEYWSLETEDGQTMAKSLGSGADNSNSLVQSVPVTFGSEYVITMKVKAGTEGPFTSVLTEATKGRIDVFGSADGTVNTVAVATAELVNATWTELSFAFKDTLVALQDQGFLNIVFEMLPEGTEVTGIEVREVTQVYDTRGVERALAYAKELLNLEDFAEAAKATGKEDAFNAAKETFQGTIGEVESQLASTVAEDEGYMSDYLTLLNEDLNNFLNAIAADTNLGDWSSWSSVNYKGFGTRGSWTFNTGSRPGATDTAGNRWSFSKNDASRESETGEGYVAIAGIQTSYNLDAYTTFANTSYGPGKYFFSIEARAVHAAYKNNTSVQKPNGNYTYGADYTEPIVGPMMVLGNDTVTFENDTIPARYYKTYYVVKEVPEGQTLTGGFYFPVDNLKKGGVFRLRNAQIRMIGTSQLDLDFETAVKNVITQQNALQVRIDSIPKVKADESLPWGKDSLDRAMTVNQPEAALADSYNWVDKDGNLLVEKTEVNLEYIQQLGSTATTGILVSVVRALNSAIAYVHTTSKPYADLVAAVADGNANLNDSEYANASTAACNGLQDAVNAGQALLNGLTADNVQTDEFNAAVKAIGDAITTYQQSVASFAKPTDLAIVNPFFLTNGGEKSRNAAGWTVTGQTDNGTWKFKNDVALNGQTFEESSNLRVDRGNTAYSKNHAIQKYVIDKAGYYEYHADAYAFQSSANQNSASVLEITTTELADGTTVADTLRDEKGKYVRHYNVFLFFGPENAPDSVEVYTDWTTGTNYYDIAEIRHYKIGYVKAADGEETVEFGMDAMWNGDLNRDGTQESVGANCYGFGSNHVYFYGDYEQYQKDYAAGISVAEKVDLPVVKGIYTLSGVKVNGSAANLPKGIYIINGKKMVIK